jgi:hypothetical protein
MRTVAMNGAQLILVLPILAGASGGQRSYNYAASSAAIREHIFSRNPGFESLQVTPPSSNRTDTYAVSDGIYSHAGTLVSVGLRVFKIVSVNPASGELSLKVWYRLAWQDDRLAWDPAAFGNVSEIYMRAADSMRRIAQPHATMQPPLPAARRAQTACRLCAGSGRQFGDLGAGRDRVQFGPGHRLDT